VKILEAADLIFTLDFNALHRVGGGMEEVLSEMKAPFIMIDHHQKTDDYAAYSYSDTSIGSTCEMLYNFISFLGKKISTKQTIGTCIYTGILTDQAPLVFRNHRKYAPDCFRINRFRLKTLKS
jgi:phosphoesterase RecJ-like protein